MNTFAQVIVVDEMRAVIVCAGLIIKIDAMVPVLIYLVLVLMLYRMLMGLKGVFTQRLDVNVAIGVCGLLVGTEVWMGSMIVGVGQSIRMILLVKRNSESKPL